MKINHIGFFLNHDCNKNCGLCSIQSFSSNYSGMTKEDYKYIISMIGDTSEFKQVVLVGGEPLIHKDYRWFVEQVLKDFPNALIRTKTNGLLLSKFIDMVSNRSVFEVSVYPKWNDEIVDQHKGVKNIRFVPYQGFANPMIDAKLNDEQALDVYDACSKELRFTGRNLYECCVGEIMERTYSIGKIHVEFDENWRENILKLKTYLACKHCFRFPNDKMRKANRDYLWEHDSLREDIAHE